MVQNISKTEISTNYAYHLTDAFRFEDIARGGDAKKINYPAGSWIPDDKKSNLRVQGIWPMRRPIPKQLKENRFLRVIEEKMPYRLRERHIDCLPEFYEETDWVKKIEKGDPYGGPATEHEMQDLLLRGSCYGKSALDVVKDEITYRGCQGMSESNGLVRLKFRIPDDQLDEAIIRETSPFEIRSLSMHFSEFRIDSVDELLEFELELYGKWQPAKEYDGSYRYPVLVLSHPIPLDGIEYTCLDCAGPWCTFGQSAPTLENKTAEVLNPDYLHIDGRWVQRGFDRIEDEAKMMHESILEAAKKGWERVNTVSTFLKYLSTGKRLDPVEIQELERILTVGEKGKIYYDGKIITARFGSGKDGHEVKCTAWSEV